MKDKIINKPKILIISIICIIIFTNCGWRYSEVYQTNISPNNYSQTLNGLDVLELSNFELISGKSIGLIVNHTSVNRDGKHFIDLLSSRSDIVVKIIFAPEHGFEGLLSAGESVSDDIEQKTGAKIISLYGKNKKPKAVDIQNLDYLIFDIQDVGARYYTYTSTMTNVMQSAGENGVEVIILDRPNPVNGVEVQGPILETEFSSFVGMHPVTIRHGLTKGELAIMINESDWLEKTNCKLTVIPMVNWMREMNWTQTNINWEAPSPNIPNYKTAFLYLGMCLLEGTNISEGRGTDYPFLQFGAPWADSEELTILLSKQFSNGVTFTPMEFTPKSIPQAKYPKYENQLCQGIQIHIDSYDINPIELGVRMIEVVHHLHPDKFKFLETNFIDKLYGSDMLRKTIENGESIDSLIQKWTKEECDFCASREQFLIKSYK
ncbi:MAG: DUF1343 domain-containing protein [Candidatus Marinimicrobia bacterium]|nr:DUF1343 domain-containing protein [Candidatus Neomarinimicrobiota bacterium]MBL7022617.1 DUF1343 domain-containing protein [Candidatus Neomarinimicrobiota bacterium]MBL7109640.1 DUF1343 domain-containing protein [Candidatus Neomarinimicrobiota bacterium]